VNCLRKAIFIIFICCCCCPWLFAGPRGIPAIELKYSLIELADSIGCKLIFFDFTGKKTDIPAGPRFHFNQANKPDARIKEYFKLLNGINNNEYSFSLDTNRKLLTVWEQKKNQEKETFLKLPVPPGEINIEERPTNAAMTALKLFLPRNIGRNRISTMGEMTELSPTANEPEPFGLGEKPHIKTLLDKLAKHGWYSHLVINHGKGRTGEQKWFMDLYSGEFELINLKKMAKILREQNILPGIMREDVNYVIKVEYPVKYYVAFEEDKFIKLLESINFMSSKPQFTDMKCLVINALIANDSEKSVGYVVNNFDHIPKSQMPVMRWNIPKEDCAGGKFKQEIIELKKKYQGK